MYHDQGHIPVKLLGFDVDPATGRWRALSGVNITLGLPIIRTSVDHGTAFDIAGRGVADATSMIEAIDYADRLAARAAASNEPASRPAEALEATVSKVFAAAGCERGRSRDDRRHLVLANLVGHELARRDPAEGVPGLAGTGHGRWPTAGDGRARDAACGHRRRRARLRPGDRRAGARPRDGQGTRHAASRPWASATPAISAASGTGRNAAPRPVSCRCTSSTPRASACWWRPGARARRGCRPTRWPQAVPVPGGQPIILDISTASIAEGKIKVARNAGTRAAGRLRGRCGRPADARSRRLLRPAARRHPAVRRPQGLRSLGDHRAAGRGA